MAEQRLGEAIEAASSFKERRSNGRCCFVARAELLDLTSNLRFSMRTADIDRGGCYVDTLNPLPVGTPVTLRVTKENQSFKADAEVVYMQTANGMGLAFTAAEAEQLRILDRWISGPDDSTSPSHSKWETSHTFEEPIASSEPRWPAASSARKEPVMYLILMLVQKAVLSEMEGKALLDKLGA